MASSPLPSSLSFLLLLLLLAFSLISAVHSSYSYSPHRPIHHRQPPHLRPSRSRSRARALPNLPASSRTTDRLFVPNATTHSNSTKSNPNSNSTTTNPNPNSNSNSKSNSSSTHGHGHGHRDGERVRKWAVGFAAGSVAGVASGLALSVLFRLALNVARGRYRSPSGPSIFSPKIIRRAEDLAFLDSDSALAALEVIGRGGCGEPTEPESRLLDKWTRQIRSEIQTVGRIRHRNLLPLLAHVTRPDCHYLVYEYMKNGSLRDALADVADGRRQLDWAARHRIALGIAAGLEYLHVHHRPQIIHRDLKPANILLDDNMDARIADFGLAKEMPDAHTHITSSNVAGTVGYIAPEYHQTLKFTAKCDMYSFGVILASLVMGKQPSDDFFQHTEEMSLVKWLRNVMNSANATAAIDPTLLGNGFEDQMLLVLRIACFCTADNPKERPSSKDVRAMLLQIKH
ncbi:Leucine-rich repeat receptor-like serine/threonine/tyrosine-protein kinase [Ananas comosus]|uniref:Leucine-rich repeat receptor-like serine/threonine/tyrosine-protein kinase n=1 Tax=Ananas comosus TaxID=4615 RepID=A0A199VCY6_ANACO|nr:Leucine-rich repeat receptor-like serine/threonine/tyrosine-protein kinase [Ananas comosus]